MCSAFAQTSQKSSHERHVGFARTSGSADASQHVGSSIRCWMAVLYLTSFEDDATVQRNLLGPVLAGHFRHSLNRESNLSEQHRNELHRRLLCRTTNDKITLLQIMTWRHTL